MICLKSHTKISIFKCTHIILLSVGKVNWFVEIIAKKNGAFSPKKIGGRKRLSQSVSGHVKTIFFLIRRTLKLEGGGFP